MPALAPHPAKKAVHRPLLTDDEFLDWLEPKVYADLIGGKIHMHSPVSLRHGDLLNFVDRLLALYIERKDLGKLHRESIAVRLGPRDVFMPDLCFFTGEQVAGLLPSHAACAPTLVVEALSRRTAHRDLGLKFAAYERYGVLEYWILDPNHLDHRFFAREGELLVEFGAGAERIDSRAVAGFYLRRDWLDPAGTPPVERCLQEIVAG